MSRVFYTPIDLTLNELKQARIQGGSSDPTFASGNSGQIFYRTDLKALRLNNGTAWVPLGGSSTGSATPVGSVVPSAVGAFFFDTTASTLYVATGLTNADWSTALKGSTSTAGLTNPASAGASATGVIGTSLNYARQDHTHAHAGADHNNIKLTDLSTTLTADYLISGSTYGIQSAKVPTADNDYVNKKYADGIAAGLNAHDAVLVATTTTLAGAYTAGTTGTDGGTGVGGFILASANGALSIDGITDVSIPAFTVGARVLVKNGITADSGTNSKANGIYVVTTVGTSGTAWKLTRASDYDNSTLGEVYPGDTTFVTNGTVNANNGYVMNVRGPGTNGAVIIDSTNNFISWTQFSGYGATSDVTYNSVTATTVSGTTVKATTVDVINAGGASIYTSVNSTGTFDAFTNATNVNINAKMTGGVVTILGGAGSSVTGGNAVTLNLASVPASNSGSSVNVNIGSGALTAISGNKAIVIGGSVGPNATAQNINIGTGTNTNTLATASAITIGSNAGANTASTTTINGNASFGAYTGYVKAAGSSVISAASTIPITDIATTTTPTGSSGVSAIGIRAAQRIVATITQVANTSVYVISHGLGSAIGQVVAQVTDSNGLVVECDVTSSATATTVTFSPTPVTGSLGTYYVTIVG